MTITLHLWEKPYVLSNGYLMARSLVIKVSMEFGNEQVDFFYLISDGHRLYC